MRELYRGNPEPYRDVLGYSVNPPGLRTYADPEIAGGGQGQTQVTHSAALLFLLTGLQPTSVAALTEPFELAVDLADAVVVRFANGAIGSLGSTGSVLPGQDEMLEYRIFGDRGHIVFDVNEGVAVIHGLRGEVASPARPAGRGALSRLGAGRQSGRHRARPRRQRLAGLARRAHGRIRRRDVPGRARGPHGARSGAEG